MSSRTASYALLFTLLCADPHAARGTLTAQSAIPDLELTEVAAATLPARFEPIGAVEHAAGGVILWSPSQIIAFDADLQIANQIRAVPAGEEVVSVRSPRWPVLQAVTRSTDGKSLVRIRTFDESGKPKDSVASIVVPGLSDAVWAVDRWLWLVAQDGSGEVRLVEPGPPVGSAALHAQVPFPGRLSAAGERIFVTEVSPPHRVWAFKPGGRAKITRPPDGLVDSLAVLLSDGRTEAWKAAPAIELDRSRLLQPVVCVRNDWRVFVLYDEVLKAGRWPVIPLPVTPVAAHPASRTVWALRRGNQAELVKYRYRWR